MLSKNKHTPGFTIVELLIVIVVIGILAVITIISFNGVQNRAYDIAIKSDLSNIADKLEFYRVTISPTNQYPSSLIVADVDVTVSKNAYGNNYIQTGNTRGYNLLYCKGTTSDIYAVVAGSRSGKTFAVTHAKAPYESTTKLTTAGQQCGDEGIAPYAAVWGFTEVAGWTGSL